MLCSAAFALSPPAAPAGSAGDEGESPAASNLEAEDERLVVVSTGTRTERDAATSPVATEVITREEIVGSGAENLAEALEESGASVQTSPGFNGTSLRLRGLDPEQVLILVDGQRVTGRIGGAIDLRRFSVENIERVEIVKGAGSVLYGSDALAGVVNIVTRPPEPGVQGEAHGSYGSRATLDLTGRLAGGGRNWGLAAFGGLHQTAGWDADLGDASTTGDALRQWSVGGSARSSVPSQLRVSLSGEYLHRDSRGVMETASGAVIDRRNLTETSTTSAGVEWLGPDSRLAFTARHSYFRDQFLQDQRGDDALDQYQPTDDHVGQLGLQFDQIAGKHVVTTGVDAQLEWLTTTRVISEQGGSSVDRQRLALFVQDEWTPALTPRISVLPALRVDFDTRFGVYPSGRFALLVEPVETLALRASYGRSFRAPSFREMFLAFSNAGVGYRVAGNEALRPEQAWGLDLGATWSPLDFLRLSAGVFDNRLEDLITTDLIADADVGGLQLFGYVNVGAAYTRGLETSGSVEFLRHWSVSGSYTLLDARDLLDGRRLPGRSTHQGALSLEFHQRRWGTRLFARAAAWSRRPFTEGTDQAFAAPYATVDLRSSQDLLRYFSVFAGVENLLDAGDATLTPLPPRSFYAGLNVRY